MKEITAIIKPFMLAKVQEALQCVGDFPGMTVSDCRGMSPARVDEAPTRRGTRKGICRESENPITMRRRSC